jgi:hypothetical protein
MGAEVDVVECEMEAMVKKAYRLWSSRNAGEACGYVDEETLACFIEERLSIEERREIIAHIADCAVCAEAIAFTLKRNPGQEALLKQAVLKDIRLLKVNTAAERY